MALEVSRWKSTKAAARFEDLYRTATTQVCDELERSGRSAPDVINVECHYGTTQCLHWAGTGDPLVLLHGHNGSWLTWAPVIANLPGRDIYALDTIGEPGGSTQTVPIDSPADLVAWLNQTLQQL